MKKKILLSLLAVLVVVAGVAALSAYEAHIINVTAHIENALSLSTYEIKFDTVFPQEYLEKKLGIGLSDSFLHTQNRVDSVAYKILQKPKPCPEEEPNCGPNGYYRNLCKFLSKIDDNDPKNDVGLPSYYVLPQPPQKPYCQEVEGVAMGTLTKISDTYDWWKIDLKVPPIAGSIGQDWPQSCAKYIVPVDGATYGCDLWVEVTDIFEKDQLAGMWHFDEGEGNIAFDSSGNGNHGTLMNNPTWTPGTHLSFDGVDDYVDVPGIANNPTQITQMAWVKTTYPSNSPWNEWNMIMTKRHVDDGSDWPTLTIYKGHAVLQVDDSYYVRPIVYGPAIVSDGNWHHIVGVKDGCNYKVYVDGKLDSSYDDCHPMGGSPYNLHIGHHGAWGVYFKGEIDEVKVYYKALSEQEIFQLYTTHLEDVSLY